MKLLQCTASLGNLKSSWETGFARQGRYSTTFNIGMMIFPSLIGDVMKDKNIVDLAMRFVSDSAGNNANKTAYFYRTSRTGFSGSSSGLVDAFIGTITNQFYNNSKLCSPLSTTDPLFFASMKTYLESGGYAMVLYRNEQPSSKTWSPNYLKFNAVTLYIFYEDYPLRRWDSTQNTWVRLKPYLYNPNASSADDMWIEYKPYRHNGTTWEE